MVKDVSKALYAMFTDACDIFSYESYVIDGVTRFKKVLKEGNVPCKVMIRAVPLIVEDFTAVSSNSVTLFFPPDCSIECGDFVRAYYMGKVLDLTLTGEISRFETHFEVGCKINEKV